MAAIDYQNINLANIRNLTEKELRATYSGLRSILRKRIERMAKKGIESPYPVPAATKDVPVKILKQEIAEIASQLRDPGSSISTQRLTSQGKAVRSLQARGFKIKRSQLSAFGRFMDLIRERMGSRYEIAVIDKFLELQRQGVNIRVIEEKFSRFLESEKDLDSLVEAAQRVKANTGSVRSVDILKELE